MTTATDFEKLGVFYLGRPYDLATRKPRPGLVLYDSKDLVTHAVCVGMTGSGKTGLCIALLEEAAIDGIPAIVIDPKGDLANLLLTFPELRPEDFQPWVNEDDARTEGPRRPTTTRASRPSCGRRASPSGARTARASGGCATRPTSPSTRRAATAGMPVSILQVLRRAAAGDPRRRASCCASASPAPRRACSACSASTPTRSRAASTSCSRPSSTTPGAQGRDLDLAALIQADPERRPSRASACSTWSPSTRRRSASSWRWRSTTCSPRPASQLAGGRAARHRPPAVHAARASRASRSSPSRTWATPSACSSSRCC